jgi:hypothetical protein
MIWKGCGHGLILDIIPALSEGTEEDLKKPYNQSPN